VNAELARAQAAVDRYLSAFEAGTMDDATAGPRLRALNETDPVDRKRAVETLVAEVRVTGPGELVPVFRVPAGDAAAGIGVHDGQVGTPGAPPSTPGITVDGPVMRVRQLRSRRGDAASSGRQM